MTDTTPLTAAELDAMEAAYRRGGVPDCWVEPIGRLLAGERLKLELESTDPVTAEWLERELGPQAVPGSRWVSIGNKLQVIERDGKGECVATHRVDNRNRGEVLGLLRWLRIPLTEQTHG